MKKILAVLLSLLMVGAYVAIFATAATVDEEITIDGVLDEKAWENATWITVLGENGANKGWQLRGTDPITPEDYQYKYAMRTDADYLYLAVESNREAGFELCALRPETGAQSGSANIRLWANHDIDTLDDGYQTLVDFQYDGTKCIVTGFVQKDDAKVGQTLDVTEVDSEQVIVTKEGSTIWEIKVALENLQYDSAKKFGTIVTVSDCDLIQNKDADGNYKTDYGALHSSENVVEDDVTKACYTLTTAFAVKDIAALALGTYEDDDESEPEEYVVEMDEPNENPEFVVNLSAPEKVAKGDSFLADITISDYSAELVDGLILINLVVRFDVDKLKFDIKDTTYLEAGKGYEKMSTELDKLIISPTTDEGEGWETTVTDFFPDEGKIVISYLTTNDDLAVNEEKDFHVQLPFAALEDVEGKTFIKILHADVTGTMTNMNDVIGNGGYVIIEIGDSIIPEPESSEESIDASVPPETGDLVGVYSLVILSLVAVAGVAIVAFKKKR